MMRLLLGLVLGMNLAGAWCAATAFDDPPKPLTAKHRKELEATFLDLNKTGLQHYQAGQLPQAAAAFEKALAAARRLYSNRDRSKLAESLRNFAGVLHALGKSAEAEPLFREAVAVNRELHPQEDHVDLAQSLFELAFMLVDREKYADAEPLFREVLAMRRRLYPKQDHPDVALTLNELGFVLKDQGKYADAEPFFRAALAMRRRLHDRQDHPELPTCMNNLATVLQAQKNYVDAEPLFRAALAMDYRLYPEQDHPHLATGLNQLALALTAQGKYADAEPLFREALAMRQRLYRVQDHPYLATSLNNLAEVLRNRGKLADAEELYRKALTMRRRLYSGRDHPLLAVSLNNLAVVLEGPDQCAEAKALGRDALAMRRRLYPHQDHHDVAQSLNNLAARLRVGGEYAEAETLFREALAMRRRLHPNQDHPDVALSLNNLAAVLKKPDQHAEAQSLFHEAMAMYRRLAAAYAIVRSEGDALGLAATYPCTRDGFLSNARAIEADAKSVYAEIWASKAALTRVFERRALAARAATADAKAAALLDRLTDRRRRRADLLLAPLPADKATRERRDTDIAEAGKEIEQLNRDLRPLLPAVDRLDKLANASWMELQKLLPVDAAMVDFLRYTRFEQEAKKPEAEGTTVCYLAFVVTRDRISWLDLGLAAPIEEAVAAWREAITSGKQIPAEVPGRVRDLTWKKVRQEVLDKVKVVYLAPDAALCRLPWAALPGDQPNTILLEDYALAVIPHAVFLLDKLMPQDPLPHPPTGVLAVGGVAYDADMLQPEKVAVNRSAPLLKPGEKLQWAALPGAAAETKGVMGAAAKRKLSARTLDGAEATTFAVLAELPRARYAHLATHGFFADASFRSAFQVDPKLFEITVRGERVGAGALSPMVMTGLVFAGANKPKTPARGIITGEALVDLDLSGLDLAVLSACETGLGDVADGEGTFGLQRAFHLAGTRDVIASLWKVPDRPTAALMAMFYRDLWDKDMPPVEALRQAQLEIYRHPERIASLADGFRGNFKVVPGTAEAPLPMDADGKAHPRLWAAFTLSGPGR